MSGRRAIIIAARRTAIGKLGGLHRNRSIEKLAAPLIPAVLSDAGLDPDAIDEVIIGNAAGGGGNPARLITLAAGMPDAVPAITLDRQCASGLDAIVMAARQIEAGAAHAVIAGGAESPSTAPWRIAKPPNPYTQLPQFFAHAMFAPSSEGHPNMIEAAENVARQFGISRERQDAFALESHRRAMNAKAQGHTEAEIVPLDSAETDHRDESPRAGLQPGLLARMKPLAAPDGSVTAGNSCQINDGAALTVVVSDELHRRFGSPPGLVFAGAASAGVDPRILGIAAVPAFERLRNQAGIAATDLDAIELNEAFAAQVLATIDLLGLQSSAINNLGGALAYGHPYGASGAIMVVRLFTRLVRNNTGSASQRGVAMIAAAGGVGTAALFHNLSASLK
jgi:acetyl-CoA C-acetyltransferase